MAKERRRTSASSKCRFCRAKVGTVDYKDIGALKKLVTPQGKMFSRKRAGNCAYHQRSVKRAVKRARFLALLQYVG
jgi:small subunit ribosomal protein S18